MDSLLCMPSALDAAAHRQSVTLLQTLCDPLTADNTHIAFGLQQQTLR